MTRIKTLKGWKDASLWRLGTPVKWRDWCTNEVQETEYVIVSSAVVPLSGPETLVFPADKRGEPLSWSELVKVNELSKGAALDKLQEAIRKGEVL